MNERPLSEKTLKECVHDTLISQSLGSEQLKSLHALSEKHRIHSEKPSAHKKNVHSWVAVFLLCIMSFGAWHAYHDYSQQRIFKNIATEVVYNHLKLKPLDVRSDTFSDVSQYFTKVDFSPIQTRLFQSTEQFVLGGRYCSIRSVPAAQIRFQTKEGKVKTLYQASYSAMDFSGVPSIDSGEVPIRIDENGLTVEIWREKGLLLVSVE